MTHEPSENIYNILLDIRESIGVLKAKSGEHDIKFDQLITQTTRTNGRVTKLEDITTSLSEHSKTLTALLSKQEGVYTQGLKAIEEKYGGCPREIDELKKKVYTKEGVDTSNTQLETVKITEGSKVKVAVYGGIFTILGSVVALLINYINK